MARSDVTFDISELQAFFNRLERASNGEFAREVQRWLDAIGVDFLRVVQDEIIRLEVVDTRALLNSFKARNRPGHNIFRKLSNGLGIECGSNLDYASYVNDGHNLRNGEWWEGYHYFDNAKFIFEDIFKEALENKLQEWLDGTFSEFT